jgi:hypothetical protein
MGQCYSSNKGGVVAPSRDANQRQNAAIEANVSRGSKSRFRKAISSSTCQPDSRQVQRYSATAEDSTSSLRSVQDGSYEQPANDVLEMDDALVEEEDYEEHANDLLSMGAAVIGQGQASGVKGLRETPLARFVQRCIDSLVNEAFPPGDRPELVFCVGGTKRSTTTPPPHVFAAYQHAGKYPTSFPYTTKCLMLFHKIDGEDVLVFMMYINVYGLGCPAPNAGIVHLEHLDSVPYGTLGRMRTPVYQEVLKATIEFHKTKGFTKVMFEAKPPTRPRYPGPHARFRDITFNGHPETQSLITADRLAEWFNGLLVASRANGVVKSVSTPQDAYLTRVSDLSEVPYVPNFCWDAHAEVVASELEAIPVVDGISTTLTVKYDNRVVIQDALTQQTVARVLADDGPTNNFYVVRLHDICAECEQKLDQAGDKYWVPPRTTTDANDDAAKQIPLSDTPFCLCDDCYYQEARRRLLSGRDSGNVALPCAFEAMVRPCAAIPDLTEGECEEIYCPIVADRDAFMKFCEDKDLFFDDLAFAKEATNSVLWWMHRACPLRCGDCDTRLTPATLFECRDYRMRCERCFKVAEESHERMLRERETAFEDDEGWLDVFMSFPAKPMCRPRGMQWRPRRMQ